jgi:hypothetical protein
MMSRSHGASVRKSLSDARGVIFVVYCTPLLIASNKLTGVEKAKTAGNASLPDEQSLT